MLDNNLKVLAKYNKITNDSMNGILKGVTEEEWDKNFDGYFKSIHELCSHIYICDFNWLKRFKLIRYFDILSNDIFEVSYSFSETIFKSLNEYIQAREKLDDIIIEFINDVKEDDLRAILKFTDSKGIKNERRVDPLIMHVFNHQAHHRGMISLYLELLGKENDFASSLYKMDF
jgi:uncharacterized damage-inducible protein DinB